MWQLSLGLLVLLVFGEVQGHGRLQDPPGRSTCWRYGFTGCVANYNDNELFCGGKGVSNDMFNSHSLLRYVLGNSPVKTMGNPFSPIGTTGKEGNHFPFRFALPDSECY